MRRVSPGALTGGVRRDTPSEPDAFEEYTELDSAGRLQLPREYMERYGIRARVRLAATDEGILVRPAPAGDAGQPANALAGILARLVSGRWKR